MIVRGDLSVGQQIAQTIHAVGESVEIAPVPPNTVAVALSVKDIAHLLEIYNKLVAANIKCVLITECDGEPMAIGCVPTRDRKSIRKVVSSLPLVK